MIHKCVSCSLFQHIIKLVIFYFSICITSLMMILMIVIYFYAYRPISSIQESKTVFIQPGMSIDQIGRVLHQNNIINSIRIFRFFVHLTHAKGPLKSGEYIFSPGISLRGVIDKLEKHEVVVHFFIVPEGMSSCELFIKLNENNILSQHLTIFPEEGSVLPGKYQYIWGMSKNALVRLMMQKAELFQLNHIFELPKGFTTWKQVITLASMVEAETSLAIERPKIASVFFNRLHRHMRLQSDPTVIYSITKGCYHLERPLTKKDLHRKSDYNTYFVKGLPVNPINNPGMDSILAVLHPDLTSDLYFVATGSVGHVFSTTLQEHNKHVENYRKRKKSV